MKTMGIRMMLVMVKRRRIVEVWREIFPVSFELLWGVSLDLAVFSDFPYL